MSVYLALLLLPLPFVALGAYLWLARQFFWRLRYGRPVSTWPKYSSCVNCGAGTVTALRNDGQEDLPLCPECFGVKAQAEQLEYRISPKGERKYDAKDLRWAARAARDYVKTEDDNG